LKVLNFVFETFHRTITILKLTPIGRRSFFSKKCSNLSFLAQEAQMKKKKFKKNCNFNCNILP
jgi:hypothetical protein